MGSQNFMADFLNGWNQGLRTRAMKNSEEQEAYNRQQDALRQQQEAEDRAIRMETFKMQQQEAKLKLKQEQIAAAQQEAAMKREAAARQMMPAPTAQDVGIQQTTPQDVGPTMDQIRVNRPTDMMPSPTGGSDIAMPQLTQGEELEQQRQIDVREGKVIQLPNDPNIPEAFRGKTVPVNPATAAFLRSYFEEPFKIADDERAANLARQRDIAAESRITTRQQADEKKRKGNATALRTEYNRQIKPYVDQIDQYNKAKATAAIPDEQRTPADDISLVFLYMKSLDPTSTVREGEYATAKNAAGIPERVRNAYNATIKGTFLSPEQRKSFAVTIERNFNSGPGARIAQIQKRYDFLAREGGIDPELVLMESGLAGDTDDGGGWETVGGVRVRRKARP